MSENRTFAELYLLMCDMVKESAEGMLERPLTPDELACVYNSGSLMMLENIEMHIATGSKDYVSKTLLSVKDFQTRLDDAKAGLPIVLEEQFLGQSLSQQHVVKLQALPSIYTAQQIVRRMEQTPQGARYDELTRVLDELI